MVLVLGVGVNSSVIIVVMIFVDMVIGSWYVLVVVDIVGLLVEMSEFNNFVGCLFWIGGDLLVLVLMVLVVVVVGYGFMVIDVIKNVGGVLVVVL